MTSDFMGVTIVTSIMGFLRTWLHVPLPLVFAEYLSQERYVNAMKLSYQIDINTSYSI